MLLNPDEQTKSAVYKSVRYLFNFKIQKRSIQQSPIGVLECVSNITLLFYPYCHSISLWGTISLSSRINTFLFRSHANKMQIRPFRLRVWQFSTNVSYWILFDFLNCRTLLLCVILIECSFNFIRLSMLGF